MVKVPAVLPPLVAAVVAVLVTATRVMEATTVVATAPRVVATLLLQARVLPIRPVVAVVMEEIVATRAPVVKAPVPSPQPPPKAV